MPWQSVAKLVLLSSHSKVELLLVWAVVLVAIIVVFAEWAEVAVQPVLPANWVVVAVVPLVYCAPWKCGSVSLNMVGL